MFKTIRLMIEAHNVLKEAKQDADNGNYGVVILREKEYQEFVTGMLKDAEEDRQRITRLDKLICDITKNGKSPCDECESAAECQRNCKGDVVTGCDEWWLKEDDDVQNDCDDGK